MQSIELGPHTPIETAAPADPKRSSSPTRRRVEYGYALAVGWLAIVAVISTCAAILPFDEPNISDFTAIAEGPSARHLLGTDEIGRDILSRLAYGGRVSLTIASISVSLGLVVGGGLGLIAGQARGKIESLITTVADVLLAFPAVVLLLVLTSIYGQGFPILVIGLAVLTVPTFIRLARANTLVVSQREFIAAAKSYGSPMRRILVRDVVPNVALPLSAYAFIVAGVVMVAEGTLSFLGLGVRSPTPSWGGMVAGGREYLSTAPHIVLIPGAILFLTVLSFTMVGEHFRKASGDQGVAL